MGNYWINKEKEERAGFPKWGTSKKRPVVCNKPSFEFDPLSKSIWEWMKKHKDIKIKKENLSFIST